MAKRKNKRKRENASAFEPIAKRTRLGTGTPMYRKEPVQYPQHWLMPRSRVKCDKDVDVIKKRIQVQANNVFNQYCQENKNLPSTSKVVSRGTPKSCTTSPCKTNRKAYRKAERARHVEYRRRRSRRRSKARKVYRRRFTPHQMAKRRRRLIVRLPKKNKRRGPRKVRRIRARKYHQRRPAFEQSVPRGHENDALFKKNDKKNQRKREDLKERVVEEDPLNVKNICRNLVKGIQGRPADSRDYQPDNTKPDSAKEKRQNLKNDSKKEENKNKVNRRRNRKSGRLAGKRRCKHSVHKRKTQRLGRRQRKPADRHVRRSAVYRSRQRGVKLGHRCVPIWRNYTKRSCRSKDVQRRQRANRSAQVDRRRKDL